MAHNAILQHRPAATAFSSTPCIKAAAINGSFTGAMRPATSLLALSCEQQSHRHTLLLYRSIASNAGWGHLCTGMTLLVVCKLDYSSLRASGQACSIHCAHIQKLQHCIGCFHLGCDSRITEPAGSVGAVTPHINPCSAGATVTHSFLCWGYRTEGGPPIYTLHCSSCRFLTSSELQVRNATLCAPI